MAFPLHKALARECIFAGGRSAAKWHGKGGTIFYISLKKAKKQRRGSHKPGPNEDVDVIN